MQLLYINDHILTIDYGEIYVRLTIINDYNIITIYIIIIVL